MRQPETPAEAIAFCEHRHIHPTHEGFGCCTPWEFDLANAEELLEDLAELGWTPPAPVVSLPRSVPKGAGTDEQIDLGPRHWMVLSLLAGVGPMTDEALTDLYARKVADGAPYAPQTPQSVRSRRAELVRAGHVRATGERRPTKNGGTAAVWAAVGSAQEALAS